MRKATTVGRHAANGRKIYLARHRKGLTQTQLGAAAGITYRQVIRLENGENLPSGPVRDRISEALDVDRLSIESGDDYEEAALSGDPFHDARDNAPARSRAGRVTSDGASVTEDAA